MLPNFLILGAQKAGTSWLSVMLDRHPDVFVYREGEIRFFSAHYGKGLNWYESHFTESAHEQAVGEKSAVYLSHPKCAARIRSTLGKKIRLIVSLRHPVDRAYSAYWHGLRSGTISPDTDFLAALEQSEVLRRRSMYGRHLRRFLEYFSLENLLVLVFEEMMEDRREALSNCYEFLGVDRTFEPDEPEQYVNRAKDIAVLIPRLHTVRRRINKLPEAIKRPIVTLGSIIFDRLPKRKRYVPLSPEVRAEASDYFVRDVELLTNILDTDLSVWEDM